MLNEASISDRLRVAFVAGTLGQGGAEKQLVLMVRALVQSNVDVRIYCCTQGEYYESQLSHLGVKPIWIGKYRNPISRLASLASQLRTFRPHIVQSAHFYTNLYVVLASKILGLSHFGSLRNDAIHEVEGNGRWGRWLIRWPAQIIANSYAAKKNASQYGVATERIFVLPNVIDTDDFDRRSTEPIELPKEFNTAVPKVLVVCRLVHAKRIDRFLRALSIANQTCLVQGIIVGDGNEKSLLQMQALELGLSSEQLVFLGWRNDIPQLMQHVDLFAITSDHEGFPNALLEAMTARLPAVGMPAGEVPAIIRDNQTGFLIEFDDLELFAAKIVQLAQAPTLRQQMGIVARQLVDKQYSADSLRAQLTGLYQNALGPKLPQLSASVL
jgi:glycosyltransferase involved in cell wall biosynthesis